MRQLKLNFQNYQFGAEDASYSELFLPQILSHFNNIMEVYQTEEEKRETRIDLKF